jgi:uncharacterized protein YjiS (DUF1127 family)
MTSRGTSVARLCHLHPLRRLWVLLTEWRQRIRLRYEVERLTEQELADMRLTREDALNEVQKPFWQR